jgi:hypothetical protein
LPSRILWQDWKRKMSMPDINIKINLKGIEKFSGDLNKAGRNLKQLGRDIQQVGSSITFAGGAIVAPLALAFKSAEKYSLGISREMDRLNNVFIGMRVSIAEAMLPVVREFTNVLANLSRAWTDLDPKLQQAIVRIALITGGFLLFGGTVIKIIGSVITFAGVIKTLFSKMVLFASVNPQIVIGILAIVSAMWVLQKAGISVASVLEVAFKGVLLVVSSVAVGIADALIDLTKLLDKIVSVVAMLPSVLGVIAKEAKGGLGGIRKELEEFSASTSNFATGMAQDIGKVFSGQGEWKQYFDSMTTGLDGFFAKLKETPVIQQFKEQIDGMKFVAEQTAQAMESSFSNFFFKAFTRETMTLKDLFADFGRSVLQIISQVLAKMLITKMLGTVNPAFKLISFHSGGMIKKAHSGTLARDEVPIIAQAGEGILSRKAMSRLGEQGLNDLNSGNGGGGGGARQPVVIIKAWDASDIVRNRKTIEGIIQNAMATNSGVRQTMMKYS